MSFTESGPRAMFGGLLWGHRAVRFVFMDEAGTDVNAPVRVVVGVHIDADRQLLRAEAAVDEVLGGVPTAIRDDFVFSAKSVWGNEAYWPHWSMADRLAFLRQMMSLPRRLNAAVSVSVVRSGTFPTPELKRMKIHQYEHFMAFAMCVARADKHIREHAGPEEIGTVVAEQASEMTEFLKEGANLFRQVPVAIPPQGVRWTEEEQRLGYQTQETELRVSRIRPTIHFVEKNEDKLVFLADACAFAFRRFFAGEKFGPEFVRHVLGSDLNSEDWVDGGHSTFHWV